jgi:hypothetical protein
MDQAYMDEDEAALEADATEVVKRSRKPSRRMSSSMLGTISDEGALLSKRTGGRGAVRGSGRGGAGRGRGRGSQGRFAEGRGEGAGGPRTRQLGHKRTLAAEEEEQEVGGDAEGFEKHPMDGAGLEEEPEWDMTVETSKGRDCALVDLPMEAHGQSYVMDDDGMTVENVWESMTLEELRAVRTPITAFIPSQQMSAKLLYITKLGSCDRLVGR